MDIVNKKMKLRVTKGSLFGDKKYGRLSFNDAALLPYIGKDVELEVAVRECDTTNR